MMADTILFDKLAYLDRLKRAGIEENQARAHAEAMDEALRESVATKADVVRLGSDVARLETTIQAEVTRLETMFHSEVASLETKIQSEATRLENVTHSEVTRLENTIHSEVTRLENKIESVETKIDLAVRDMTIRMGAIAMALFAALASIKFFG
jgi:hypothetical protein